MNLVNAGGDTCVATHGYKASFYKGLCILSPFQPGYNTSVYLCTAIFTWYLSDPGISKKIIRITHENTFKNSTEGYLMISKSPHLLFCILSSIAQDSFNQLHVESFIALNNKL